MGPRARMLLADRILVPSLSPPLASQFGQNMPHPSPTEFAKEHLPLAHGGDEGCDHIDAIGCSSVDRNSSPRVRILPLKWRYRWGGASWCGPSLLNFHSILLVVKEDFAWLGGLQISVPSCASVVVLDGVGDRRHPVVNPAVSRSCLFAQSSLMPRSFPLMDNNLDLD